MTTTNMPAPKIEMRDLNVYYGNFHAIKNISFN